MSITLVTNRSKSLSFTFDRAARICPSFMLKKCMKCCLNASRAKYTVYVSPAGKTVPLHLIKDTSLDLSFSRLKSLTAVKCDLAKSKLKMLWEIIKKAPSLRVAERARASVFLSACLVECDVPHTSSHSTLNRELRQRVRASASRADHVAQSSLQIGWDSSESHSARASPRRDSSVSRLSGIVAAESMLSK